MSIQLRGASPMVVRLFATFAFTYLIACGAPAEQSLTICDIARQPERYDGQSVELDATFTSDGFHHSYVMAVDCGRPSDVEIGVDESGSSGRPSLFWELVQAHRQSTPAQWYGISAHAKLRIRFLRTREPDFVVDVEDISRPRLVPIRPPPPMPAPTATRPR